MLPTSHHVSIIIIFNGKLDYVSRVVLMICKQLDVDHATFIQENIEYLLSMWLIKNYQLAKFPWFLAPCTTQNDFFNDHIETLTICILRHKSEILKDFVPLIAGESMASIIDVTNFTLDKKFINFNLAFVGVYSQSSHIV